MAFELGSGRLNLKDLNSYLQTNFGSFEGLKNGNTTQARDFLKKLNNLSSLRNDMVGKAGKDGALSDTQAAEIRKQATGVSAARLSAQKSQMPDANACPDPNANDPYKSSNGKKYRNGPALADVMGGNKSFTEGDRGSGVKDLQKKLVAAGYNLGPKGADGYYGPATAKAAQDFFTKYKDLGNNMNQKALERVNGVVEGIRSVKGTGLDAR